MWVKEIAAPFNGKSVYTSTVQYIYQWFHHHLETQGTRGLVVCDSRNKGLNTVVAHSIFTQKFRAAGDKYPDILEMPLFGHSDNHIGLQLADVLCSAMLFPMAVHAYCTGHVHGVHVRAGYGELRRRYGAHLERLQDRVPDLAVASGRRLIGGVTVADPLGRKSRQEMFTAPTGAASLLAASPIGGASATAEQNLT